ncbi:MAG: PhnD/SsuA/transferrin family substrate-binding protein, partial [Actinomycetota bacterium]
MRFVSYMTPGFPVPLFASMAGALGADLHLVTDRSGPDPAADPFAAAHYDLGWICSTSYVGLALGTPEPSVELAGVAWVPDDPDNGGRPVYFGDLVVRPDSRVDRLADLSGARIGCNDHVSLSGHYALRWAAADAGLDPDSFAELVFTGGHHRSLDLLLAGELDAVVVDSVVRSQRTRTDRPVADLRLVDRLGPWPTQPLVARSGLDDSAVARARQGLLAAADQPPLAALLRASALTGLVEVDPDHYDPVR